MSEYWKSTPKYYCKHCKMFVVDTPVSKKNHDASMKHQGSLKRFLRDLHRANEKEQNAATAAKREVARLNAIVGGGGGGGGSLSSAGGASSNTLTYKPQAPRGTNEEERKRQLKELEALGVALPDEARRELAMVGDWTEAEVDVKADRGMSEKEKVQVEIARQQKRKFEEEEKERKWNAMDEDEKAMRGFSIQTKTYPAKGAALKGGFKPMVFKGKGKAKEEDGATGVKKQDASEVKVKKEQDEEAEVNTEDLPEEKEETDEVPGIKKEDVEVEGVDIKTEQDAEVRKEPDSIGDGIVFKKRKVKNIRKRE